MTPEELKQRASSYLARPDLRPKLLKDLTDQAPTTLPYLRFFYELACELKPKYVLETGTDRGRSAAHFALGNPDSIVVTLDIDPACSQNCRNLGIPNIKEISGESLGYTSGPVDILFLDSLHTYEHTIAEWHVFQKCVKPGGLAFFDDIHLDQSMERFWREVQGAKVDLSELHYSGFGAVVL